MLRRGRRRQRSIVQHTAWGRFQWPCTPRLEGAGILGAVDFGDVHPDGIRGSSYLLRSIYLRQGCCADRFAASKRSSHPERGGTEYWAE